MANEQQVQAVRRFNRFYTRTIGVLRDKWLGSPFPLTEVRVLFELAHRERPTASELCAELGLDPGYLSRILRGFQKRGLVARARSEHDGRQSHLSLTAAGRKAFAPLDGRARDETAAMLARLPASDQARVLGAMETIESLLGERSSTGNRAAYLLRPLQPGDLGWVVHRHGALYAQEHGYDERFEALVAKIAAEFVERNDPKRERAWIAEREGEIVGSVFLVKKTATVAKLRLLLVEPSARGLGIGRRLVEECVRFARQAGYRKITLWTQRPLKAARAIYEKAGFKLVGEERHHLFGPELVAETWELGLGSAPLVSDKSWGEWDAAADWYDQNMGEHGDLLNRGLLRPLVLDMLGDTTGLTLLDCGCGSGYLTAELATRARHVTGTDVSPAFVALCRRKYGQLANLEFLDHDLTTPMPLAERTVDAVLCKMALQYVPRIETFARESCRVLREGGRLLVVVDHPFHAQFHYAQRLAGLDHPKYADLGNYFDLHERVKLSLWGRVALTWYPRTLSSYVQTFIDAGFRLEELRELPEPEVEVPVPRILALTLRRPSWRP